MVQQVGMGCGKRDQKTEALQRKDLVKVPLHTSSCLRFALLWLFFLVFLYPLFDGLSAFAGQVVFSNPTTIFTLFAF